MLPEDRVLRDAQPIEDNDSDEEQKDPEILFQLQVSNEKRAQTVV